MHQNITEIYECADKDLRNLGSLLCQLMILFNLGRKLNLEGSENFTS